MRVISHDCKEVIRLVKHERVFIPEQRLGRKVRYQFPSDCELRHIGGRIVQVTVKGTEPAQIDLEDLSPRLLTPAERVMRLEQCKKQSKKKPVPESKKVEVSQGKRLLKMASEATRMTFVRAICEKEIRQALAKELGVAWLHASKPEHAAKLDARKPTEDQVRFRMQQLMVVARYYFPDIEANAPA